MIYSPSGGSFSGYSPQYGYGGSYFDDFSWDKVSSGVGKVNKAAGDALKTATDVFDLVGTAKQTVDAFSSKPKSSVGLPVSLRETSGKAAGQYALDYYNTAFPGTNPWERLGSGNPGTGSLQARLGAQMQREGFGVQKDINQATLNNNLRIARIEKEKAENVAQIHKSGTVYSSDQSYKGQTEAAETHAAAQEYSADKHFDVGVYQAQSQLQGTIFSAKSHLEGTNIIADATRDAALNAPEAGRSFWSTLKGVHDWSEGKSLGDIGQYLIDNPATSALLATYGLSAGGIISKGAASVMGKGKKAKKWASETYKKVKDNPKLSWIIKKAGEVKSSMKNKIDYLHKRFGTKKSPKSTPGKSSSNFNYRYPRGSDITLEKNLGSPVK